MGRMSGCKLFIIEFKAGIGKIMSMQVTWERRQNTKVLLLPRISQEAVSAPKILLFDFHERNLGEVASPTVPENEIDLQNLVFAADKPLPMTAFVLLGG